METLSAVLALTIGSLLVGGAGAGDKEKKEEGKEVTLKGKITCAKCDLGKTAKCATVIVVKEDKKDLVYYFDAASHKKHHSAICTDPMDGSVTGVTSKD